MCEYIGVNIRELSLLAGNHIHYYSHANVFSILSICDYQIFGFVSCMSLKINLNVEKDMIVY